MLGFEPLDWDVSPEAGVGGQTNEQTNGQTSALEHLYALEHFLMQTKSRRFEFAGRR